jgi:hypothetical protein
MSKEILLNIQNKIAAIPGINYVDEDWGQLDDYGPHAPVQWPCCLIDFSGADYTEIGIDKSATPQNRQEGTGSITLIFANLKITKSSAKAPTPQKDTAWLLSGLMEEAHKVVHGFKPGTNTGALIRRSFRRVKRDDGIQQYQVIYSLGVHNV